MNVPELSTVPLTSALPPESVARVACAATEVTPLKASVPESASVPLTISVLPLVAETVAPAPTEPPLKVSVLALTTARCEPETMVPPRIRSTVPLTVSISALAPLVASRPPESVTPPRSSVAALTAALTTKVPALAMAPLQGQFAAVSNLNDRAGDDRGAADHVMAAARRFDDAAAHRLPLAAGNGPAGERDHGAAARGENVAFGVVDRPAEYNQPRREHLDERGVDHRPDNLRRAAAGRSDRVALADHPAAHRQDGAVEGGKLGVGADRDVGRGQGAADRLDDRPRHDRRAADRIVAPGRKHKRVLRGLQFAAEDRPADEIDLFIRAGNQHQAGAGVADRRALDEDAGAGARRQDAGGINEIALDEEDAAAGCFHLARIDPGY